MILLQETTADWKVPTPNHIYIFGRSSTKAIGYIKAGTTVAIRFNQPMQFDRRFRTFETIKVKDHRGYDLSAVTSP